MPYNEHNEIDLFDVKPTYRKFEAKTPDYVGPMDLLVYLVRKRELDIACISISALTIDFLNWIEKYPTPDLNQIGDFILLTAILLEYKVNELLAIPEPEITEIEITNALREHSTADLSALHISVQKLAELEERQSNLFDRGGVYISGLESELSEEMLSDVSIYDIAVAFRELIYHLPPEPTHLIDQIPYTLEGQMAFIMEFFGNSKRISFNKLSAVLDSRLAVVMTFLAILELLRLGKLAVRQSEAFGPIWIIKK